jgi:hypothetical protein
VVEQPTHEDEINIKGSIPGTDPGGEEMEKCKIYEKFKFTR